MSKHGIGDAQIATLLNAWRTARGLVILSRAAVTGFIHRSPIVKKYRRLTEKTGKSDPDAKWSIARLAQARQMKEQLRVGRLPENSPELVNPIYPPIYLDGVVFIDEKHKKCVLGCNSKYEVQVACNPAGQPTLEEHGGVFPPRMPRKKEKFPKEARGCFAAGCRPHVDTGSPEGVKMEPFQYTGKMVVGSCFECCE